MIVAFSQGHSDINRFRPWSPIATGQEIIWIAQNAKIPEVTQTTETVDEFDLRSDI
jgi:hypothetical protein